MKIEISLRDFLDFITDEDFEISIYENGNENALVYYTYVSSVLTGHKNLLNRKVDYIDLEHWNDRSWLMINLK